MSQVRRIRRAAGKSPTWWKSVLTAVAVTAAVAVFALIIGLTEVPDGVIRIVNQLIKIGAVFAGVRAAVHRGDENAIRKGIVIGLVYMGAGVLVYALLTRQSGTPMGYAMDLLMGPAACPA